MGRRGGALPSRKRDHALPVPSLEALSLLCCAGSKQGYWTLSNSVSKNKPNHPRKCTRKTADAVLPATHPGRLEELHQHHQHHHQSTKGSLSKHQELPCLHMQLDAAEDADPQAAGPWAVSSAPSSQQSGRHLSKGWCGRADPGPMAGGMAREGGGRLEQARRGVCRRSSSARLLGRPHAQVPLPSHRPLSRFFGLHLLSVVVVVSRSIGG